MLCNFCLPFFLSTRNTSSRDIVIHLSLNKSSTMPKCYEQFKAAAALTDKVILECLYIGVGFSRLDDVGVIPAFSLD